MYLKWFCSIQIHLNDKMFPTIHIHLKDSPKRQNYPDGKQVSGSWGLGSKVKVELNFLKEDWGVLELFCILIVIVVT